MHKINNKLKNIVTVFTVVSIMSFLVYTPVQAQMIPLNRLGEVERLIYGEIKEDGEIQNRIEELELTLYNEVQEGTLANRALDIVDFVYYEDGRSTLVFLMNVMEWSVTKDIYSGPVLDRINQLEKRIFGESTENSGLVKRIERLSNAVLSDEELPAEKVTLPEAELEIELLDTISSAEAEVGDIYEFEVLDNVIIDGVLVIPENIKGTIRVNEVEKAGNLGKDGVINLEIFDLIAIDGSSITLDFDTAEIEDTGYSREMAVVAGILAAVAVNNPLGLGVGYFVKGKNEEISAGTRLTVKTTGKETVNGIIFN